ncbi:DUF2254 domain-containing protein [Glaciecola sp. MF2-115]|uniref:DUF2254 domain-containing protein n=1 Tax=Glaciecola sp. MF2-115 TaxID=3384827 RepID=UPI00399F6068
MKNLTQRYSFWQYRFWLINLKKAARLIGSSFWFIPSVMIILAIISSLLLPILPLPAFIEGMLTSYFVDISDETSSSVISLIASSVITVTSIAFSMTIVALVMASNQFGPRLIKNFMQNTMTQLVLGTFTSTFIFCVLVLSKINTASVSSYYGELSLTMALTLAIVNILVLIFFIHHVATSIRADTVVQQIASYLMKDMKKLQCGSQREHQLKDFVDVSKYKHSLKITSKCDGYIQAIEYQHIVDIAKQHEGLMIIHYRSGQYIVPGTPIATLYSDNEVAPNCSLDGSIVIGKERTALQDPLFAINQLVEMAIRALSPSLDDPFTATNCIDGLASAMGSFSEENIPITSVVDEDNEIRITTADPTFNDLFQGAFTQIRQASASHAFVVLHLLDTFITLVKACNSEIHMCEAIKNQFEAINQYHQSTDIFMNDVDRHRFNERLEVLEGLLGAN